MWSSIFDMQVSLADKTIRTVLVYVGIAALLRVAGKRELAQLNSFDLVVVLLLSNVVQNAIIGPDNSLTGGLLGAAILMAINGGVVRGVHQHPLLLRLFEGTPTVLVDRGRMLTRRIHRLGLREADVTVALRRQGADETSEVERAVLEPGGALVVSLAQEARDLTPADLREASAELAATLRAEVEASLRGLEQRLATRLDDLKG